MLLNQASWALMHHWGVDGSLVNVGLLANGENVRRTPTPNWRPNGALQPWCFIWHIFWRPLDVMHDRIILQCEPKAIRICVLMHLYAWGSSTSVQASLVPVCALPNPRCTNPEGIYQLNNSFNKTQNVYYARCKNHETWSHHSKFFRV